MRLLDDRRLAEQARAMGVEVVVASRTENVRYIADLPDELTTALGLRVAILARCDPFEVISLVAPRVMAAAIPPGLISEADVRLYGRFFALEANVDLDETEQ